MPKKRLFAGLSLADPETGIVPVPKGPDFEFTTGLAADMAQHLENGTPLPKRASGNSPVTKPSMRPESRRAPFALDRYQNEKDDPMFSGKRRSLSYVGYGDRQGAREFRPLTKAEGARNLGLTPEHVAERRNFPRMNRATGTPRVRTDSGSPMPNGRTSASAKIERVNKTGARKRRAAGKSRPRSTDKPVFNGKAGMTARNVVTPEKRAEIATRRVADTLVTLQTRTRAAQQSSAEARAEAKRQLADAIGRERDAKARGDMAAAEATRADIRKFRKASKFTGE